MKNKFIYITLSALIFLSCEKEKISNTEANEHSNEDSYDKRLPAGFSLTEEKRSYVWVDDKLDCTQPGSGCIVESRLSTNQGEVDLSISQAIKLIEIGRGDFNEAFKKNELRFEFPSLYEKGYIVSGIATGSVSVTFRFPYLIINDNAENTETIFNYEGTLDHPEVRAALQGGGSYTKKVQLNTDTDTPAVWKCTEPGDNCKVASLRFNATWLKDNPSYLYAPTKESIINAEADNGGESERVIIETVSGNKYGIEF